MTALKISESATTQSNTTTTLAASAEAAKQAMDTSVIVDTMVSDINSNTNLNGSKTGMDSNATSTSLQNDQVMTTDKTSSTVTQVTAPSDPAQTDVPVPTVDVALDVVTTETISTADASNTQDVSLADSSKNSTMTMQAQNSSIVDPVKDLPTAEPASMRRLIGAEQAIASSEQSKTGRKTTQTNIIKSEATSVTTTQATTETTAETTSVTTNQVTQEPAQTTQSQPIQATQEPTQTTQLSQTIKGQVPTTHHRVVPATDVPIQTIPITTNQTAQEPVQTTRESVQTTQEPVQTTEESAQTTPLTAPQTTPLTAPQTTQEHVQTTPLTAPQTTQEPVQSTNDTITDHDTHFLPRPSHPNLHIEPVNDIVTSTITVIVSVIETNTSQQEYMEPNTSIADVQTVFPLIDAMPTAPTTRSIPAQSTDTNVAILTVLVAREALDDLDQRLLQLRNQVLQARNIHEFRAAYKLLKEMQRKMRKSLITLSQHGLHYKTKTKEQTKGHKKHKRK